MDTLKKSQIVSPTVESTRSPFTGNSQGNEMAYFIENFLNGRVNTSLPCKVQAVYSDGISVKTVITNVLIKNSPKSDASFPSRAKTKSAETENTTSDGIRQLLKKQTQEEQWEKDGK